jgi:hypothetical protein
MVNNSVTSTAVHGIQSGLQEFRRVAAKIARGVGKNEQPMATTDYTRSVAELKQHELQTSASAKAFKAYNDSLGSLLDERA